MVLGRSQIDMFCENFDSVSPIISDLFSGKRSAGPHQGLGFVMSGAEQIIFVMCSEI